MVHTLTSPRTIRAGARASFSEGLHQFELYFTASASVIVSRQGNSPGCNYPLAVSATECQGQPIQFNSATYSCQRACRLPQAQ